MAQAQAERRAAEEALALSLRLIECVRGFSGKKQTRQ